MAYYARVVNDIVTAVIVAESDYIENYIETGTGQWIETSQNGSFRKNFASVGDTYDAARDAFYRPQPYPSWSLNETTCRWEPPTPYPNDGQTYYWIEERLAWETGPEVV